MLDAVRRVIAVTEKNEPAAIDELDKFLMDVLFGFKSKEWAFSDEYVARNVLTVIERLSKQLGVDLSWYYAGLSEHAHPNYLGMMAVYRETPQMGDPVVRFADSPNESRDTSIKIAIGGLAITLEMTELALDRHVQVSSGFATLCEREIYEGGKWPPDIEYPIRR